MMEHAYQSAFVFYSCALPPIVPISGKQSGTPHWMEDCVLRTRPITSVGAGESNPTKERPCPLLVGLSSLERRKGDRVITGLTAPATARWS